MPKQRQLVVGANVVAPEDAQPAEPAQKHVLGGPVTDAAQVRPAVDGGSTVELVQGLQVELAADDRAGGLGDRPRLAQAEAVALELPRRHASEPMGSRNARGPGRSPDTDRP